MAILAESMATPNTFATLAVRTFTCLTAGRLPVASVIAPISPPQISFISVVARSIACCCKLKSTPRSKRNDESEPNPYCRAFPAMISGVNHALSITTLRVLSVTELSTPPINPAILRTCFSSATTSVLLLRVTVLSLRHSSVSPSWARRTISLPEILSSSNICIG